MSHIYTPKFLLLGILATFLGLNSFPAQSQTNDNFENYLRDRCRGENDGVDFLDRLFESGGEAALSAFVDFCNDPSIASGGFANINSPAAFPSQGNFGTSGAQSRAANVITVNQQDTVKDRIEERKNEGGGGASADSGGWGILATVLSGDTERKETELENGFKSDLSGYVLGADYRFSDAFVLGLAIGSVEIDADFVGGSGGLQTESNSTTVYATWTPTENLSLDIYLGGADSDSDSSRTASFGNLDGVFASSNKSSQDFYGISANYDWYLDAWSIGTFLNIDSIETAIDGYAEQRVSGSASLDTLALRYPKQNTESFTTSYGLRLGYAAQYGWGTLLPSLRIAMLSEDEDDARIIDARPVLFPGDEDAFEVATEAPDRDYMINSFGLVAAFNNGIQVFLQYEEWSSHDFLDTSSVNLGVLIGF